MNLVKEFLLLKAKVDKLYCQLIAKSPDEQDPTVPNHVKTIKQEDIDNWNNVKEEEVQITEDTVFAQIEQTQKDFNKNVSDYKTNSDLKNQEQDDRLTNIEGENIAQNDLINDLSSTIDYEIIRNNSQDSRLENLEGITYTWSPTNRTLTLFDREGNQLSQVSLVSLDNEGTDIRYNASTLSLELYNADNELLDSIPVSSFIGSVGTQLQLNSNQLQLKDSQGNVLSTVTFSVSNINGLQTALDTKLEKGTYTGTAQDLKNSIDNKLNKPTTTSTTTSYPYVVGEDGNGNSARLPAGDLGKNFFNSDLSNTSARNHTMNAGVTINTLGNPHTLSGLPNKNADIANFRKVRVQNTSGLDAVVDSKNILLDMPTLLNTTEKISWMNNWTGVYSTGAPTVTSIIMPVIKKINGTVKISIYGTNLYFNKEVSYIRFKESTNYSIWHSVDDFTVISSNQIDVIVDLNNTNINTEYVFELKHMTYLYTSNEKFLIVDNFTPVDISNLTWSLAKETYADEILTSSRINNNTITENYIARSSTNSGGNTDNKPINVWKTGNLIPLGFNGVVKISFNINYDTSGFEFPMTFDDFGLAEFINTETISITTTPNTMRSSIGTGFQTYNSGSKSTKINGGSTLSGHVGEAFFIKIYGSIKVILIVGKSTAVYNNILITDVDLALMLVLKGRYLGAKYIGTYSLNEVYTF